MRWYVGASMLACCLTSAVGQSACVPSLLGQFESAGWPEKLDWGIYWVGRDDQLSKATSSGASSVYNPGHPTLIYMHGWTGGKSEGKGGWMVNCKRVTTSCPTSACTETGEGTLLAEPWLDQGWNVGFFYWDQFADEPCPRRAEQKIWFDREGDGLRWKSYKVSDGSEEFPQLREPGIMSVADLCSQAVHTAMSGYHGKHVRFAGHSIGAQLAVRCAGLLHEVGHEAAPQRIALLEPFFTKRELLYFFNTPGCQDSTYSEPVGGFTEKATAEEIAHMQEHFNIAVEIYKSSLLTEAQDVMGKKIEAGTSSRELEKLGALVRFSPRWCGGLEWVPDTLDLSDLGNLVCRHLAVFPLYFLSIGEPPPPVHSELQPGPAISTCLTPSASCDDDSIRMWAIRQSCLNGTTQRWVQVSGAETFNVTDDTFELQPALLESELSLTPSMAAEGCSTGHTSQAAMPLLFGMESPSDSGADEPEEAWYEHHINLLLVVVAVLFTFGTAFLLVQTYRQPKQYADVHADDESDSEVGNRITRQALLVEEAEE